MRTLIRDIAFLMTSNSRQEELTDAYVVIDNNVISSVGTGPLPPNIQPDRTYSGARKLMMPGFVNTHHHLFQTLFRNVPQVEHAKLFDWLTFLYEHWKYIDEEAAYVSARQGYAKCSKQASRRRQTTSICILTAIMRCLTPRSGPRGHWCALSPHERKHVAQQEERRLASRHCGADR